MRHVPQKVRDSKSPKCLNCGAKAEEMHHALIYAGRQIDESFAVVPLCSHCHRGNNGTIFPLARLKSEDQAITDGLIILANKYSKRNWQERRHFVRREIKRLSV